MNNITLVFHGDLQELLPKSLQSQQSIRIPLSGRVALKHLIENLGIPHTEIGRVERGTVQISMMTHPKSGEVYHLYPEIDPPAICPLFIADNHLARLAEWLRLLGFDTAYSQGWEDEQIAKIAFDEGRVLLSRDRGLLKRNIVAQGYCVRSDFPHLQVKEVVLRYHLVPYFQPFSRCQRCNGTLAPVLKKNIIEQLESLTRQYYDEFHRCSQCSNIYWKGSHYQKILLFIRSLERQ